MSSQPRVQHSDFGDGRAGLFLTAELNRGSTNVTFGSANITHAGSLGSLMCHLAFDNTIKSTALPIFRYEELLLFGFTRALSHTTYSSRPRATRITI